MIVSIKTKDFKGYVSGKAKRSLLFGSMLIVVADIIKVLF